MSTYTSAGELGKKIGYTDEQFFKFAKQADTSGDVLQQYKDYLKSTTAATHTFSNALKKATAIAANMAIMAVVSKGIEIAYKAIDNYVNRVDKAKESTEKIISSFKETNSSLASNKQFIDENASRFDELSKHVTSLGENISLTTEEFDEYKSLSQKIAEMYPQLVTGYDAQGEAVVRLTDSVKELNAEYEKAKENANWQLIQQGSELLGNYDTVVNDNVGGYYTQLEQYQRLLRATELEYSDFASEISNSPILQQRIIDMGIGLNFKEADMPHIKQAIHSTIQSINTSIEAEKSNITPLLNAYLNNNDEYKNLSDGKLKSAISTLIQNVDTEVINGFNGNDLFASNYVNSVVNSITEDDTVQKALVELFSLDSEKLSVDDLKTKVDSYIDTIASAIGKDSLSLKISLGFDNVDDLSAKYKDVIKRFDDKFKEDPISLSKFFENNSINTQEELDKWIKIANGCNTAAEAKKRYLETGKDDTTTSLSISSTIDQLNTQLAPTFEALKKSYQDIFTDDGFTLENVDLSMLENIKSVMDEMAEAGLGIDTSGFENLVRVLTDSSSTADDVHNAFDSLASSVLNNTGVIKNLDSSTAQLVASMLESLGVANAEEVVYDALKMKTEALALEKQFAAEAGHELVNATNEEVISFLNHAGASETARQYLFKLISAEQIFGNTDLNTSEKVAKLKELATAYGQTAIAARIANLEKASTDGHIAIDYDKELASLQNEINSAVNNVQIDFDGSKAAAGKAGKKAADAYLEAFEKELKHLDDLKDRGRISEKQYLDELRKLYLKYFNQKKKYLDQFAQYESEYLQGKFLPTIIVI